MANISTSIEEVNNLLIVNVEGNLSTQEIIDIAESVYIQRGQSKILWDLSKSSVRQLKQREVSELAKKIAKFRSFSAAAKTAVIAQTLADFAIIRMYQTLAESSNEMVEYEVFYTQEEARKWLLDNNTPPQEQAVNPKSNHNCS